jgi:IclR family transcriptional regulator, KDG regulon repressor
LAGNTSLTVEKALIIIDYIAEFASNSNGIGINELARKVGMNQTTVHRILATLVKYKYLRQDINTQKYNLGFKLVHLGNRVTENFELTKTARPYLEKLSEKTKESINLMVINEYEGIYIDTIQGKHQVRLVSHVGTKEPLHGSGVGKAIMAFLNEEKVREIINKKGLKKMTENTITTEEELFRELAATRERGYSIDRGESQDGIVCVGTPIFDNNNYPVAALSVAAPEFRMDEEKIKNYGKLFKKVSTEITNILSC